MSNTNDQFVKTQERKMKNFVALITGVALTALIGSVNVSLAAGTSQDKKPDDKPMVVDYNSSRSNLSETQKIGVESKSGDTDQVTTAPGTGKPLDKKEEAKKDDGG